MSISLHHHRLGLHLFLILAGFYLLTFHGQPVSRDEQIMLAHSRAMLHGSMSFPPVYEATTSEYGIGLPLTAIPFTLFDTMVSLKSGKPWPQFAHLANAGITAMLGLLFYLFALRLGYTREDGFISALLLGLTTQLFPYAGTFFSEPLTTLFLFAAFGAAWIGVEEQSPKLFAVAGGMLAASMLTRFASIIYVPLFLFFAWGAAPSFHGWRPLAPGQLLRRMAGLLVPVGVACLIQLVLNRSIRGGMLDFGYSGSDFTTGYLAGVWGLLFSPGRGLFVYNPLILITLICAPAFLRRHASAGAFAMLFFAITLIFHARFWTWHGGWTPGSRFLLPALPFLFLFLSEGLSRWEQRDAGWRLSVALLAAAGVVIQAAHILVNPLEANNELFGLLGRQENAFLFIPHISSLQGVWLLMADGAWRWRAWQGLGLLPWTVPLLGLVMAVVAGRKVYGPLLRHGVLPSIGDAWRLIRRPAAMAAILLLAVIVLTARFGKGERGLNIALTMTDPDAASQPFHPYRGGGFARWSIAPGTDSATRVNTPGIEWTGWLHAPLTGTYRFFAKARGNYELRLGDTVLFANEQFQAPQHLRSAEITLERGRFYPLMGRFDPDPDTGGLFNVYWTLPGEGVALAHIDREYLFPAPPGRVAAFFTAVWRKLWLLILAVVLPVFVFAANPAPLWRRRRSE